MDFYKDARREFFEFILPNWADPLYTGTIILVFGVISLRKNFKNWDDLEEHQRRYLKGLLFVTTMGVIASILQLFSLI